MRVQLLVFLMCLVAACSNGDEEDYFLQQPPLTGLTDSIRQQPGNAELYYRRAALLLQNDQLKYAEADLRKAWSLAPAEKYALGLAGVLSRKSPDSAIAFIQRARKILPQSIGLQVSLAKEYQSKKEPDKAIAICNQILARLPNQLDALELKAGILLDQQKDAEALTVLEQAYSYAPFDVDLSFNLAFQYAQAKNAKALSLSDSLIKMDASGRHAEPYYFKGVYYANTGNDVQALDFFDQAIQHDYYFIDAYMEKGRLLYNHKRYDKALHTFQLATTVSPTFADAYLWIGKVQQATGNKTEAKLNYQRAYALDNTLTEARDSL